MPNSAPQRAVSLFREIMGLSRTERLALNIYFQASGAFFIAQQRGILDPGRYFQLGFACHQFEGVRSQQELGMDPEYCAGNYNSCPNLPIV